MNNHLKAVSSNDNELRVSNYIVLFGGSDLVGDHFTKNTNFDSSYLKSTVLHVDFEHGLNVDGAGMDSNEVLGFVDWKTASIDENGIFVERVLNRHAKYMKFIEPLINDGLIGNSSEAIKGRVKKSITGEITEWPLMRDTLTVTPMEPRMISANSLAAIKALNIPIEDAEEIDSLESCKTFKDIEAVLRHKHGLSQKAATAMVGAVKRVEKHREGVSQTDDELKLLNNFKIGG
mgnify:CR=1 FL=1